MGKPGEKKIQIEHQTAKLALRHFGIQALE
jgi:hypothetical protein